MTEINNNNIQQTPITKTEFKNNIKPEVVKDTPAVENERPCVQDTGVLGRSQVDGLKGSDVSKSVDKAVELAEKNPVGLQASEDIFEIMYDKFLKAGMSKEEAYAKATIAEERFMETAHIE